MSAPRVAVAGRQLLLSEHAFERYQERVRPALTLSQASDELLRVIAHAEWGSVRPSWVTLADEDPGRPTAGWLMLGDSIAFPVHGELIFTCVSRSGKSEKARERRSERRAKRPRKSEMKPHGKVKAREAARYRARRDKLAGQDAA